MILLSKQRLQEVIDYATALELRARYSNAGSVGDLEDIVAALEELMEIRTMQDEHVKSAGVNKRAA
jgi:hypothetical protein